MKSIKIFILLIFVVFLNGCYEKCPPFNEDLLTWMPSEKGDVLKYSNEQNDTLTFTAFGKSISEEYRKRSAIRCSSQASLALRDNNNYDTYSVSMIYYEDNKVSLISSFSLIIDFEERIYSLGSFNIDDIECCIDTLTVNNVFYNETITMECDTILHPSTKSYYYRIWKAIVANNYGVIKFYDRYTGYEWTLIE